MFQKQLSLRSITARKMASRTSKRSLKWFPTLRHSATPRSNGKGGVDSSICKHTQPNRSTSFSPHQTSSKREKILSKHCQGKDEMLPLTIHYAIDLLLLCVKACGSRKLDDSAISSPIGFTLLQSSIFPLLQLPFFFEGRKIFITKSKAKAKVGKKKL